LLDETRSSSSFSNARWRLALRMNSAAADRALGGGLAVSLRNLSREA